MEIEVTSDQVGVGLVGSGFIGQVHAEAFSRSDVVSARTVASRSPARAAAFARQQGFRRGIPTTGSLPRVPMSIWCAWRRRTGCIVDITGAATEAGKRVGCEKPSARNSRRPMKGSPRAAGQGKLIYAAEL